LQFLCPISLDHYSREEGERKILNAAIKSGLAYEPLLSMALIAGISKETLDSLLKEQAGDNSH